MKLIHRMIIQETALRFLKRRRYCSTCHCDKDVQTHIQPRRTIHQRVTIQQSGMGYRQSQGHMR